MSGHIQSLASRAGLVLPPVLAILLVLPGSASAAVSRYYTFAGAEVWATSTVGTFVGLSLGSTGDYGSWRASIEHSVQTEPQGWITGGYAEVYTSDLTHVRGDFTGGTLVLVSTGSGPCGMLTHDIYGTLANVVRSDSTRVGTGSFVGRLFHYRVWVLGTCLIYSASVSGTMTLSFTGNN